MSSGREHTYTQKKNMERFNGEPLNWRRGTALGEKNTSDNVENLMKIRDCSLEDITC